MPSNEFNIPNNLKQRLGDRKVIPFVGAGVSVPVLTRETAESAFPDWKQLLLEAAEQLREQNKDADANFVSAGLEIAQPDFLATAQYARQHLGGSLWNEFLKARLDPDFESIQVESLDLARAVWELKSSLVITTNYDKVLRWACPDSENLDTWDIEAPAEQSASLSSGMRRPTIWHLHGHIGNVARLILTTDDYKLLYPEDSSIKDAYDAALQTFRTYLSTHTFLFVGFSFSDAHVVAQFEWIQKLFGDYGGQHYALVRDSNVDQVRQLGLTSLDLVTFQEFTDLPRLVRHLGTFAADPIDVGESTTSQDALAADEMDASERRGIYGRAEEIKELARLIEKTPLVAVYGLTGIGKSTLINEVRHRTSVASRRSVSFRATGQMTLAQFYQQAAVVLGDESEDAQPPATGQFGEGLFLSRVRKASPGLIHIENAQVVFDGRKYRDPELGAFLRLLAEKVPQIRVVLECREEPPNLGLSDKFAKVWQLRGLGQEGVRRFFLRPFPDHPDCAWDLTPSEVESVQERLSHDGRKQGRAHPLAMVLLATVAEGLPLSPVEVLRKHPGLLVEQLEKKLFHDLYDSVLDADEQRVLRMCALYRDQIPDGHADHLNESVTSTDAFSHLVRRCLLTPDEEHEWYSLHALISKLTAARVSSNDSDFQANHQAIAEAWLVTVGTGKRLSRPKIRATAEAVHHLIAGESYERLREIQKHFIKGPSREQLEALSAKLKVQGKSHENRYVLELLVESAPGDAKHRRFLGETLERILSKGNDQSLALYLEAHSLIPRFPQYLANLGRCWLARKEPQNFIEHVTQLPEEVHTSVMNDHCNSILADCMTQVGDSAAASQLRQSRIAAGSRDPAFYHDEAGYLMDSDKPKDALALLDQAVKLGIDNEYTQSIRASALAASGEPAAASQLRLTQIEAGSRNPVFYADEAKYLMDSGKPKDALAMLDQAATLGIDNEYTQSVRASALAASGDPAAASQLRLSLIEAGSRNPVFYADEAKYLMDSGKLDEALAILDQAVKLGIDNKYTQGIRQSVLRKQQPGASPTPQPAAIAGDSSELQEAKRQIKTHMERGDFAEALSAIDAAGERGLIDRELLELRRDAAGG
jgi:tetratricopeptide (TPR) repeat protein